MVYFAYARSRSRRTAVEDPREASPRGYGGPQVLSYVGANIVCEQGKSCVSHQESFRFSFESLFLY
jgi:hypothetical protein